MGTSHSNEPQCLCHARKLFEEIYKIYRIDKITLVILYFSSKVGPSLQILHDEVEHHLAHVLDEQRIGDAVAGFWVEH